MNITNRTNEVLTCVTESTSAWESGAILWEWLHPGQSLSPKKQGQGRHDVYLTVLPGKVSAGAPLNWREKRISRGGPYLNTHGYLLVNGGRTVIDWSDVSRKHMSGPGSPPGAGGPADPAVARGLEASSAIFSALSTGLSATGPIGAVPAGFFSLVASMMLLGEEGPPEPPDLTKIEQVVEKVVERVIKEELQRDNARKAAAKFLRAQDFLLTKERAFRSGVGKDGSPTGKGTDRDEQARHFVEELEGWAASSGDFQGHVDLMRGEPEIAKWIIPAFVAGIAAYLQIWRLHALLREPLSADTIVRFQAEVDMSREALLAAAGAWRRHCDAILREESIAGTPEGRQVREALTRAYAGTDDIGPADMPGLPEDAREAIDPTPIGRAVWNLRRTHEYLAEDLAAMRDGKPPRHFWKESWVRSEPAAG